MRSPKKGKIAHNNTFENRWTFDQGKDYWVNNWEWDTCLAAHCIDNKKRTGLKPLTYINFGVIGYGFLGTAITHGFGLHADIKIYDKFLEY